MMKNILKPMNANQCIRVAGKDHVGKSTGKSTAVMPVRLFSFFRPFAD